MRILEGQTITDIPGIKATGVAGGLKKSGKKDVITSYSIHYTKLYEFRGSGRYSRKSNSDVRRGDNGGSKSRRNFLQS